MKLTVLQENLYPALRTALKAISSRPPLPILNSFLLKAEKKEISIAATDLYLGMTALIAGVVEQTGRALVPAKLFTESVRSLPVGKLELELNDNTLHVSHPAGKIKIQCQPSAEFPEFPSPDGQQFQLEPQLVKDIDHYVSFSVSQDLTRQVLTTLLFKPTKQGLQVVGTDGFRLSVLTLADTALRFEDGQSVLVPARAFNEISSILKISHSGDKTKSPQDESSQATAGDELVRLVVSDQLKHIFFMVPNLEVSARIVEGQYPPYNKIIPKSFELETTLEVAELVDQVSRALVFARRSSNIVTWQFSDDELKISAQADGQGVFDGRVPLGSKVKAPVKIAFNGRYLHDLLARLNSDTVWFGMNDSLKPVMFKEPGNSNFQHVIMPFRLND